MTELLELLERFNRKERYHVVAGLQGAHLRMSNDFRSRLSQAVGLEVPADALVATDFHLDWLFAALRMAEGLRVGAPAPNTHEGVQGSQEDIDVLVAFKRNETTHVLLLEWHETVSANGQATLVCRASLAGSWAPGARARTLGVV